MLERVRGLLHSDPDPQVVANCLVVMLQVGCPVTGNNLH